MLNKSPVAAKLADGRNRRLVALMACWGAVVAAPAPATPPTFYNLGVFSSGGTYSNGGQVSADGWIVTGYGDINPGGNRGFRWTLAGGLQNLGVPSGFSWTAANSISADGTTIAGNLGVRGFRWTSASGPQNLGTLPSGTISIAYGVSGDGSTVVGYSSNGSTFLATRWTSTGVLDIGTLPGGYTGGSAAQAISSNGTTIVGSSAWSGSSFARAFRWTAAGGMQNLGILFGGTKSFAFGVSSNGGAVTGFSDWVGDESLGDRAFRYTSSLGLRNLGVPPGANHSYGNVMSGDGLVVAGRASFPSGNRACLWTNSLGMVDLNTYLVSQGVNLTGWVLTEANGLSYDGSAISGTGVFGGQNRAFLVRGVAVPSIVVVHTFPIDRTSGPTGTVVFTVGAEGSDPIVYQWQWRPPGGLQWVDVVDGVNSNPFTGEPLFVGDGGRAESVTLTNSVGSSAVATGGRREIRVVVSNPYGSETTNPVEWVTCYANCDNSDVLPVLNANDFQCFLNSFASGSPYANCDESMVMPVLNANDFQCFLNAFAGGCP